MTGATTNRRITTSIVAGLALVALIVHLLTIHRYGYFRDELYYIACARHLDFGYVDLAPLSAFLLRIELILFGSSLFALRIFPALASALTIVLTGILTRELGGRAWAIALACTSMLGSLFFLAVGNFYSPNVYEPLFWTGAIYLLCRIINGAPSHTWLWFGVVVGFGIQNKHSMVFFGVAIVVAILLTPRRRQFCAKMDLARRFRCPCHRAPEHHLANRTRLAQLGVVARYRKEQQKRCSQPVGIFLPTDHLDESGDLSGVVWRIFALRFRWLKPAIAFLV